MFIAAPNSLLNQPQHQTLNQNSNLNYSNSGITNELPLHSHSQMHSNSHLIPSHSHPSLSSSSSLAQAQAGSGSLAYDYDSSDFNEIPGQSNSAHLSMANFKGSGNSNFGQSQNHQQQQSLGLSQNLNQNSNGNSPNQINSSLSYSSTSSGQPQSLPHSQSLPLMSPICKNFEFGRCSKGENCRFAHPTGGNLAAILGNSANTNTSMNSMNMNSIGNGNGNNGAAPLISNSNNFPGFLPFGHSKTFTSLQSTSSSSAVTSAPKTKNICWDFIAGRCDRGITCKYSHQNNANGNSANFQFNNGGHVRSNSGGNINSLGQNNLSQSSSSNNSVLFGDSVCHQYQKSGRCQYGENCKFAHVGGPTTGLNLNLNLVGNNLNIASLSSIAAQNQSNMFSPTQSNASGFNSSASSGGVLNTTINASPNSLSGNGYTLNVQNLPATINGQEVCRFYAKTGRCKYGNACKFVHINGPGLGSANLIHHQHHNQTSGSGSVTPGHLNNPLGLSLNLNQNNSSVVSSHSPVSSNSSNPFAGLNLPAGVSPALIAQLLGNLTNGTLNANTLAILANAVQQQQQNQNNNNNGSNSGTSSQAASTAASPSHSNSRSESFFRSSSINHSQLHSSIQSTFQEDDQDLDDLLNIKVDDSINIGMHDTISMSSFLPSSSSPASGIGLNNNSANSIPAIASANSSTPAARTLSPFYGADAFSAFSTGFGRSSNPNRNSANRPLAESLEQVLATIKANSSVACIKCSTLPSVYSRGFLTLCWRCCPCTHCGENEGRAVCAMGVCGDCYEETAGERIR